MRPRILDITDGVAGSGECFFQNGGSCTVQAPINLNVGFSLRLLLNTTNVVSGAVFAGQNPGDANSWDTAYISSLLFSDANGNPLDLSYTTRSGLTYPMPQPGSVPEPVTLVLLGIGLAGLGASRRRKQ